MNRSGTKWLSNELTKFSNIIAVQNHNTGIRESNILQAIPKKFDLRYVDEYIGAIELWSSTQFFQKTGVDKTIFYEKNYREKDWLFHLDLLMSTYAQKNGKNYWLQKFSPEKVLTYDLSNYHIICIKRNIVDQIRSNISRYKSQPKFIDMLRAVLSYLRQEKYIDELAEKYNAKIVEYESLKTDKKEALKQIVENFREDVGVYEENVEFKKNSSFSRKERHTYLSETQEKQIPLLYQFLKHIPHSMLTPMAVKNASKHQLVAGTFQDIRLKYSHLVDKRN